jgi:hypothetical protein
MASPSPRPNMMYEWQGFSYPVKGWRYEKETMQKLHDEGKIYYPKDQNGKFDYSKRPALKRYLYVTIHSEVKMSGKYHKHREVINEYIEKGYRFVGYIPTSVSANGQIMEMDLIFELKE